MVTIVDYKERHREDGTSFYALEIQGGIELVMSQTTGEYYATSKRAYISSTFNEQTCASLIGTQIQGAITKQECAPYQFVVKETGESIVLTHKWVYIPEAEEKQEQLGKPNKALFMNVNSLVTGADGELQYAN